jgi:nucleoside-diphosphate-sugar epimerase
MVTAILPQADVALDAGPDPDDDELGLLDISAAAERLGWRPSVGLAAGIRAYAEALSASAWGSSSSPTWEWGSVANVG